MDFDSVNLLYLLEWRLFSAICCLVKKVGTYDSLQQQQFTTSILAATFILDSVKDRSSKSSFPRQSGSKTQP